MLKITRFKHGIGYDNNILMIEITERLLNQFPVIKKSFVREPAVWKGNNNGKKKMQLL